MNEATITAIHCPTCSKVKLTPGIFMDRTFDFDVTQRKLYYAVSDPATNEIVKYIKAFPSMLNKYLNNNTLLATKIKNLCETCLSDIETSGIPRFSKKGGFDFGCDVPDCLKDLTFAEDALIARISIIINLGSLKRNGPPIL